MSAPNRYRIEPWADDDSRSGGGRRYTVVEIAADGTETDARTTSDEDEALEFVAERGGSLDGDG